MRGRARQRGQTCWRHGLYCARLDFSRLRSPNVGSVRARARAVRSPRQAPCKGTLMSYTPGRFVWFEHLSNDIPKARAFYEKLFGWNAETMAMPGHRSVRDDPQRRQRHRRLRAGAGRLAAAMDVVPLGERRRQHLQGGARRRREEPGRADGLRLGAAARRRSPIRPAACSRSGAAPRATRPRSRRRRPAAGSGTSSRPRTRRWRSRSTRRCSASLTTRCRCPKAPTSC